MAKKLKYIEFDLIKENDLIADSLLKGTLEAKALERWITECRKAKDGLILDIGSYNGLYAILAAKVSNNKILAFEPLKNNYDRILENLVINNLSNNVTVYNFALGDSDSKREMHTTRDIPNPTASTFNPEFVKANYKDTANIKMVMLDTLLDIEEKISIIKIDVEKFEEAVLKGASKILKRYKPKIFIELLDSKQKKFTFNYLTQFGYKNIELLGDNTKDRNYIIT